MLVIETLTWRALSGVSDEEMIAAVDALVPDLKELPGFEYQALYKSSDGTWQETYFWQTEHDAHKSNELMADKASLRNLLALIEAESIEMNVMPVLQQSSAPMFS